MGVGLYRTLHPGGQVRSRMAGVMDGVIEMLCRKRREDDACRKDNSGFRYAGSPATFRRQTGSTLHPACEQYMVIGED
mgnify:CR=1 FL=1